MKPEFVDNRNGNTFVNTLQGHLDWLRLIAVLKYYSTWADKK